MALVVAACSGTATLTDPDEILARTVTAAEETDSVRIDVSVGGEVPLDEGGLPVSLDGTRFGLDMDAQNGRLRASFSIPMLFGLAGELIAVDDTAWVRTSLSGADYFVLDAETLGGDLPLDLGGLGGASPDVDPDEAFAELRRLLADPVLDPELLDDVECAAGTCYQIRVELTPEKLAQMDGAGGLDDLPTDLGEGTLTLTVRVGRESLRLDGIDLEVDGGPEGSLSIEIAFTGWNEALDISPPPADQVTEGNPFDLFGGF
jgi:hypothetical protein